MLTCSDTPRGLHSVADEAADEIAKAAKLAKHVLDSGGTVLAPGGAIAFYRRIQGKKGLGWLQRMVRGSAIQQVTDDLLSRSGAMQRYGIIPNQGSKLRTLSDLGALLRPDYQIPLGGGKWAIVDLTRTKQASKILKYSHRDVVFMRNVFY